MNKCKRLICWHGIVSEIIVEKHAYVWSGRIPCTGVKKCIYCGKVKEENES